MNVVKDRYADRPSSSSTSDYRSSANNRDDSRNPTSKSRYYDTYERPPVAAASTSAWNTTATHQFPTVNASDIWNGNKQQQDSTSAAAWRGNSNSAVEDNRDYRFSNNDRKVTTQHYSMDAQSLRANQYINNGSAPIIPPSSRFSNNQRW